MVGQVAWLKTSFSESQAHAINFPFLLFDHYLILCTHPLDQLFGVWCCPLRTLVILSPIYYMSQKTFCHVKCVKLPQYQHTKY